MPRQSPLKKKQYKYIATFFLIFALALICSSAFAGYKIILKNGRDFIVDNYTEADGKIRFYRSGGIIELDRSNIESIKKVKASSQAEETAPSETGAAKKDSADGQTSVDKDKDAPSKKQEIENRLREIGKKKEELGNEDKKIAEDRKKLEEDKAKEGHVTYARQKREFERRAAEITERIRKFNEELNRVDDEEARLVKELQELNAPKKKE
ncbi:MAG: hypothetical protein EPN94_03550 [Nitrospirae bacterium]|nr:MAG: hypothetical protein EPN94_03550 [Nitrospirota bacterium]